MPYEVLSRALAYASCLSTVSLFATSMAIAAVNVGKLRPAPACEGAVCAATLAKPAPKTAGLKDKAPIEAVAAVIWSKKT